MNRLISDSVIYCLPFGIYKSPVIWIGFLSICKAFMWRMFIEGLPVRCGIACGDYFVDDNVIAGKPIADACEVCNSQDWTGGSLSKSCVEEMNNLNRKEISTIMFDRLVIPYATPFKKNPENECQYAIDWIDYLELKEYKNIDLKQLIVDKFSLHGKTISDSVNIKIDNTYDFLNYRLGNM